MSLHNLAEQLAHAARDLNSTEVEETLEQAIALAMRLIEGCDGAGVTLVRPGHVLETPACTAEFVARGDALQYELREGPCIEAVWEHEIVTSTDLTTEVSWPAWGPRAVAELGVRSVMCVQLFVEEEILGSLNLYSMQPFGAFARTEDRYVAQNLATHISLALFAAQQIERLNLTVISRNPIGQAEGILMARLDISAKEAYDILKQVSSSSNMNLFSVAAEIVHTRQVPAQISPRPGAPSTGAPAA